MGGGMNLSLFNLGRLRKESNKKKKQNNHKKPINMWNYWVLTKGLGNIGGTEKHTSRKKC